MSDASVRAALRSDHPLVLVEAPAGCGKTYQGADYARELVTTSTRGRPLILTHTHAACSVFAERTSGHRNAIEIRTIDSVIAGIATAYHKGLGLPADTSAWVRRRENGYAELAVKVAGLLKRYPMIASSLARRHPSVICDEHQDSSGDQHAVVMALLEQGAKVRVFADPMQKIFSDKTIDDSCPPCDWNDLKKVPHAYEELDVPHRWKDSSPALGAWTLAARKTLSSGGVIDLKDARPDGLDVTGTRKSLERPLIKRRRRSSDWRGTRTARAASTKASPCANRYPASTKTATVRGPRKRPWQPTRRAKRR